MNSPNGKPKLGVHPLLQNLMRAFPGQPPHRPLPEITHPVPDGSEGETQIRIEWKPGGVRICFSKPISWFGLEPTGARELAQHLIELADLAEKDPPEESRIILPGDQH
jgi:hypothetical protein